MFENLFDFGRICYTWDKYSMHISDIVSFKITYGDLPIVTVKYDMASLRIKNSINGSRDGWMAFPDGYFDEKTITLSNQERNIILNCLNSLDMDTFTTDPDVFGKIGACGFCINKEFSCEFSNGRSFRCILPKCDGFKFLVSTMNRIVDGDCLDPASSQPLDLHNGFVDNNIERPIDFYDPEETVQVCEHCNATMPMRYRYCGMCGKPFRCYIKDAE